ncbi:hypothetical protein B0H14DRAFT_3130453 [Mycena olivaceomarginata]|nr:hypothetical protein B0H14DRAFT_3130453 [Mycena olivaceomarginata]
MAKETTLLCIVAGIYGLCFWLDLLQAILCAIMGIRISPFISVSLTVALILNQFSFTISMVLALLVIHAIVSGDRKNLFPLRIINASHIPFGIAVGLWLMILLFQTHGSVFEGERSAIVTTIAVGWAVQILGTLTMNEYCKVTPVKPKGLEISYPIPVAVEYGSGVAQSVVPHRSAAQVANTARVNSLVALPEHWNP